MKKRKKINFWLQTTIAVFLTIIILFLGTIAIETLSFQLIVDRFVIPLLRLMLFIAIGLFVGQTIEAAGWTQHIASLARPLFRFGYLGNLSSAAFTTAFFSGAAANAMLFDGFKEGKISKHDLFITNIVNHFPAYFLHLPTTFFIVVPLTGMAGLLYFLITFCAMILRVMATLFFNRMICKKSAINHDVMEIPNSKQKKTNQIQSGMPFWKIIFERLINRFVGIAVFVVPIYTLIFTINAAGVFQLARSFIAQIVTSTFIPIEALSIVVLSFAAEFTSGFASAGAMMDAGILTTKQTTIALLIGNLVAFPVRAIRHQLPRYMGIFTPIMGLQLLGIGQFLRIFSLILVTIAYFAIA
jgi:hypothetical protein